MAACRFSLLFMAKSGMNSKTLQYIMGHADIAITMNTYARITLEDVREDVLKVAKTEQ